MPSGLCDIIPPSAAALSADVNPQRSRNIMGWVCTCLVPGNPDRHLLVCVRADACVCLLEPGCGLVSLPKALFSTLSLVSPYPEPRPLMKLRVSSSVWLIGQVCPGLWLPVIEVSIEGPLCSRRCTLLLSSSATKTLSTPPSASP